jgi:ariadne-1
MSDCSVNDDEEFYEPSESDYSLHDESQPNNVTTSTSTGKSLLETEPVHTLRGDPYVIVNTFKILPILEQMLAHISSVLHTSLDNAKTLLIEYNWDQEKLLEAYYSDPEKVLDSSGVSFTEVASHFSSPFICTICFNTVTTAASSISLTCNHSFCTTCFTQYLTIQVDEGPGSVCTLCPQHQCNRRVPCSLFQQLLDENTYDKYTKYVLRTYIDMSKDMRWCPAPGCDLIIAASPGTRATVKCQCGCTFCFACGELSHQPASCR